MEYNRNFFIAIILSMLVLLGWNYFFVAAPQNQDARQEVQIAQQMEENQQNPMAGGTGKIPAATAGNVVHVQEKPTIEMTEQGRAEVLAGDARVAIDTPELKGSINLVGTRFDDLSLKNYRMTVAKDSPNIELLNPARFKEGYIAEVAFSGVTNGLRVPDSNTLWQVEGENHTLTPQNPVRLVFDNGAGVIFHRTISVDDKYMFTLADSVENRTDARILLGTRGLVYRFSPPKEASSSAVLHEGFIGSMGDGGMETKSYSKLADAKGKDRRAAFEEVTGGGWVGITDKYWAVAVIPAQNTRFSAQFSFSDRVNPRYQSELRAEAVYIQPGMQQSFTNRVFAGAKQVDVLDGYENRLGIRHFGFLIDWGRLGFIAKPMFVLIDWLFKLVGNFGVAILLVTVILKVFLFPLANKSYKSMARMKTVQPAMMEIRGKYADDKTKQQQAIMELYKREKINPLAGCWPLLVQFPIFFALYKVLYITIDMRHEPFFGWIHDLTAPDPTSMFNLFGLLPFDVPGFLAIGAWPVIMGITMFLQMRMNPTPPDPTQAMIFTWMPVVFTWMMAAFPAGLVIYWAWNNTLSIIQQSIIMKRQGAKIELFDNLKALFVHKPKA